MDADLPAITGGTGPREVTPDTFAEGFGESIEQALDVNTWQTGEDLGTIFSRIDREVREAVDQESEYRAAVRSAVFPRLADYPGAPSGAGVYRAHPAVLERIYRGVLFNGGIEAADGTLLSHDTLPLTIFQIGVSLVSYLGDQGTWSHRLFRRDLRMSGIDPETEIFDLLERREQRNGLNEPGERDVLARLARRGIMAYAERAVLLHRSQAPWRLGHGTPAPFELLTGSGSLDLMIESTRVIRQLIEEHQKFVYVASEPSARVLLTIGEALRPLEYAVVSSLRDVIYRTIQASHYSVSRPHVASTTWDGEVLTPYEWLLRFRDEVAPQVVVGVYRATAPAPPQVFYAHRDHVELAAHIAIADSMLQEQRGFPLLIDLADAVCRGVFGQETLRAPVDNAYADAGVPFRYLSERQSRYGAR